MRSRENSTDLCMQKFRLFDCSSQKAELLKVNKDMSCRPKTTLVTTRRWRNYDAVICNMNWLNHHKYNWMANKVVTMKAMKHKKQIYQHAYRVYSDIDPRKSQYDCCVFPLYHQDITTGQAADPQPSPISTCMPWACSLLHICAVHCIESPPTITAHANIMHLSPKWPIMCQVGCR